MKINKQIYNFYEDELNDKQGAVISELPSINHNLKESLKNTIVTYSTYIVILFFSFGATYMSSKKDYSKVYKQKILAQKVQEVPDNLYQHTMIVSSYLKSKGGR